MCKSLQLPLLFLFFAFGLLQVQAQTISINEFVTSNQTTIADEDSSYEDWIEIYNYGTSSINLTGFGISDDAKTPFKWVFPNVNIAANQYLLVWASSKNRAVSGNPLHTNFKISSSGETLLITRADSVLIDSVPGIAIPANSSYGRQPDGTGLFKVFTTPTPNASNTGNAGFVDPPTFSHTSGLYQAAFNLSITHTNNNAIIVYSLDGSEPNINNLSGTSYQYKNVYQINATDSIGPFLTTSYTSNTYTAPINIRNRSADADKYTNINTRQHVAYVPPVPVRKGVVLKARAYINGVASAVVTKTFFVWPQGNPYNIPVISLQVTEDNFFDYTKGIYTAGIDYDTWRAANPTNPQYFRPEWCNYWRSGKEWEYPVHVEIFAPLAFKSIISKNGGVRIHGNNSRSKAIKSLRLYAHDEGNFEFSLFKEKLFGTTTDNTQFKRVVLRGQGSGGFVSYDVVCNRLMQPVFAGISRIKPAIHFLNGEYWGLTAVRDRLDQYHFGLNYNLTPDNIIMIACRAENCDLDEGTSADYDEYISMRDYIIDNDMGNPVNFAKADSMLNMSSFIDHMAFEIFIADDSYERSYWKVRTPEAGIYGDGKWRITVQDFETALRNETNWLSYWANLSNHPNQALFGNLLANNNFKTSFLNRFADLMNTVYETQRFKSIIDTTFNEIEPYLAEDKNRFPREDFYEPLEKQNLTNWANNQQKTMRDTLVSFFNLAGTFNLNLNISEVDAGYIKVNTVDIDPRTPGVKEIPYPWTGVYFKNVPITLKAVASPGYVFSHWSGQASGTLDSVYVLSNGTYNAIANFKEDSTTLPRPIYFWTIDKKIANDVPFETIPATFTSNALNATIKYTSCLTGYPFTSQHPDWRRASIERKNAPTPINYRPSANDDVLYDSADIRGLQVKQPFRKNGLENTVTFDVSTINLDQIKLSFAAQSDGAAQQLIVDYWDGQKWATSNMLDSVFALTNMYALFTVNFSQITIANNNPSFKIRVRFNGQNLESDSGLGVNFNNIAIDGKRNLSGGVASVTKASNVLSAFPNPTENNLSLLSDQNMQTITVLNMLGQTVHTITNSAKECIFSLQELPASIYFVRVQWKDQEKTIKIIKQ